MARFFPVRSQCHFDTSGEQRFSDENSEKDGGFLFAEIPSCKKNLPPFSTTVNEISAAFGRYEAAQVAIKG